MPKGAKGRGKDKLTQGLTRLFKHAKGYIRISSTKPGELAWGDGDIGGVFSFKFVSAIIAEAKNKGDKADWKKLLKPFNGAISMRLKSGDTTDDQHPRVESSISYNASSGNAGNAGQSNNSANDGAANDGAASAGQSKMRTLKLFVSFKHRDGFTAATETGYRDAKKAGYRFWGDQGRIFAKKMPGTVPLNLYYSAKRRDNFSTSSRFGNAAARAAGYRFVRVQGYVYPKARKGAVPLLNFWGGPARWADNFTTTNRGLASFLSKRLRFMRAGIEGYVLKAPGSRGKDKKLSKKQLGLFKKAKKDTKGLDFDKFLNRAKSGGGDKAAGGKKSKLNRKKVMAGLKKHCRADVKKLCKKVKKKTAKNLVKCLSKNRKKVSKRCVKFSRALKRSAKRKNKALNSNG